MGDNSEEPVDGRTVVVWQADGSPRAGTGYGTPLARLLRQRGFTVRLVHLPDRAPSEIERRAPFHVLSGGDTSVAADVDWVHDARHALTEVVARARTGDANVVGICFGAQLLATTLGGPDAVGVCDRGMEAGLGRVYTTDDTPIDRSTLVVGQFHHHVVQADAVTASGGRVVLSNEHTAVQGFEFGPRMAGYQFHPEWSPAEAADVVHVAGELLVRTGCRTVRAMRSVDDGSDGWRPATFDRLVSDRLVGAGAERSSMSSSAP